MKFALTSLNSLILASLLASTGAMAQGSDATPIAPDSGTAATTGQGAMPHHGEHRMGPYDPARMQAQMAKRQAELKSRLKITPDQESAWTLFTAAMQPPARTMGGERPMAEQRAELEKLTTPERIDRMKAMRAQRMTDMNAVMDKRGEATKAFYAALSLEQQKAFDAEHRKMGGHGGYGGPGHHGGMAHRKG